MTSQGFAELQAQIDILMKSAVRQHKLARRICVHDARQKITARIGRATSTNQLWKEYRASLSQQEQIRANVSDSAIWDKLANRAAHVADEEEIAEAICAAKDNPAVWKAIFENAYITATEDICVSD